MKTDLVKINPKEYGLEESKAKQISDMFKPMLDKMTELEDDYNKVVKMEISPEACIEAKHLRLQYVKVRTGTAKIHQELKQFYLQGGRFVDGWKNAQLMASQGIEEKLMDIEKYYENLEKQKIEELQVKRQNILHEYEPEMNIPNLGEMSADVWVNYIGGVKMNYEARIAAEKKAEEDRIAREKAEREERERIRMENEKLKKEAEKRERLAKIEAEKREKAEKTRKAREEKERKEREEKERIEREAYEAKIKAERDLRARIEKEERERAERAEAELKAKIEAEQRAKEEEEARIQAELSKGDSDKVNDLIADLSGLKSKYQFKSVKNKRMYSDVSLLIDKVINHIETFGR